MSRAALVAAGVAVLLAGSGPTRAQPMPRLLSQGDTTRWAYVLWPVRARAAPTLSAGAVAVVAPTTPEGADDLVLALAANAKGSWVRIRLAVLPNNSTGWVPRSALGPFHAIRTRLVVDRERLTAVLYRAGRPVFRTRVGVGHAYWPTPHGEFYVREKLTGFDDPFYGPIAFGTSGRSAVLTDWPGGGYIGIHGTSEPQLIPGWISHGCIRMRNAAIRRLAALMPLGTPVTVR